MKTDGNSRKGCCGGFSMIEVLVASTILIVIVMMLGMLFQQTSLAWRIGVKRADGYMQVRGVIGAIQRDAAAAVDARFLPKELVTGSQTFDGSLLFYTLTGIDEKRALTKVTYTSAGVRTASVLEGNGSWGAAASANLLPVTFGRKGNTSLTRLEPFKAEYGALDSAGLPLYVTFGAKVSASGSTLDIGAASAGPDKVWGTKDDIRTWVEQK